MTMGLQRHAVFVINLLQDVNVVRPLVYLAASDTDASIVLLVSNAFYKRDATLAWTFELDRIRYQTGATIAKFASDFDAYLVLEGKSGILVTGSESGLPAHRVTHDVLRIAPAGFLRVTLQHGFECVGFLHNYEQTAVHGDRVHFAADVLAGWYNVEALKSLSPSERDKVYVAGPPSLAAERVPPADRPADGMGLICENLHSVRLNVSNLKGGFMRDFFAFCDAMAAADKQVALRPHPGGQYVLKNNVPLPDNVTLDNRPMYNVDLRRFAYGISAPSSVVLDMLLAGIPTAVWRDEDDLIDASNYEGLTRVGGVDDWIAFAQAATADPQPFLDRQERFLRSLGMPIDPATVRDNYARLLCSVLGAAPVRPRPLPPGILFLANGLIPTLDIYFQKPLAPLVAAGKLRTATLTELDLDARFEQADGAEASGWMIGQIEAFDPAVIVASRYSGPNGDAVIDHARSRGIPVVFHLDDDLLNIPIELGERKYNFHNAPARLAAIRTMLKRATLVYAATPVLADRVAVIEPQQTIVTGAICRAAAGIVPAELRPVRRIGYMGFDHAHDLEMILPALVEVLRRNPEVRFELFGAIPKPAALDEFGSRISVTPPIPNYTAFTEYFRHIGWDIGICPLVDTPFNRAKTHIKWVDYSEAGIAVVASRGMLYDECCSDGCGALASSNEEWVARIEALIHSPRARYDLVARAQQRLAAAYSPALLREQVTGVLLAVAPDLDLDLGTATPVAMASEPVPA